MKITESHLRKIVREAIEIINQESGEVLTVDQVPPLYKDRLMKDGNHLTLHDSDFESLRNDLTLDPDEALADLEEEAADMMGEAHGDLGTAIDLALGLKLNDPKKWSAALKTQRIKEFYYDQDSYGDSFRSKDDALATWLAERMS